MTTHITVSGVGYVGLTTAACFARLGNAVVGFDVDRDKVGFLRSGRTGLSEPGLAELVAENVLSGRLRFTDDPADAMREAEIAFICVGTPADATGRADLGAVYATAQTLATHAQRTFITVLKSTAPSGSAEKLAAVLAEHIACGLRSPVVSNPEFLREGSALADFFAPDRVVVGSWDRAAADRVAALYGSLRAPVLITDPPTAQLIKYASSAFLATKISFINEIARIAESSAANVAVVAAGMGFDRRIGPAFLDAGLGYGGSCFPKDVLALATQCADGGRPSPLLQAVIDVNAARRRLAVTALREALRGDGCGSRVCVLGLAFKPDTDDVREAPALEIISRLCESGVLVRAYDPVAAAAATRVLPPHAGLRYCESPYDAAQGSSALFIATDWPQFRELDWRRMRCVMSGATIVDGRGLLHGDDMTALGFRYVGMAG
jgi:UDPglucose 6-dehydrogenase